ncbi:MAG: hypothetical protein CMJ78_04760 [Planctomycetaceae bacterium]|nr:hypothetical protein [Planctomycetaceae bacterium]
MTIRFVCDCGATLKIKDELAGNPGKCPKCKTKFTIPKPEETTEPESSYESFESADDTPPPPQMSDEEAEEFDVLSVLMEDEPKKKRERTPRAARRERKMAEKPTSLNISDDDDDLSDFMSSDSSSEAAPVATARRPPKSKGSAAGSSAGLLQTSGKKPKGGDDWDEADVEEAKPFLSDSQIEMIKYYVFRGAPGVAATIAIAVAVFIMANAAMSPELDLPDLGTVTGRVTMNGEPIGGATIRFNPMEADRAGSGKSDSYARTDSDGQFEMRYTKDVAGAVVGLHRVYISKRVDGVGEAIPLRYSQRAEFKYEVNPGENENVNFDLEPQ